MVFTEFSYAFFLLVSLAAFYLVPRKYRLFPIIIASVAFYWYFAGDFLFILLAETFLFYFLLRQIKNTAIFWTVLCSVVGILAYFKYRLLIAELIDKVLPIHLSGALPAQIVAPLAISFFTFEFIHYWIDTRHGRINQHSLVNFLAFIFFFPTMFAGPIKRYEPFSAQFETTHTSMQDIRTGLFRILFGFFKKVVIADSLTEWVTVLDSQRSASLVSPYILWVGVVAYAFKIYMDFSGYSDIAIGSSKLFGFTVPENFNKPYLKRNISLFWKNWHMSLTSWIWDYVFMPISASLRNLASPKYIVFIVAFSSFITLTIVGLWHGAEVHFIVWGAYHGMLLVFYTLYARFVKPSLSIHKWYHGRLFSIGATAFTFFLVLLSWPFFATDISTALYILQKMFFLA
jgi:alginate O-acetyltransferase complex protein AlgI